MAQPGMARLFIALWPGDALRQALRDWREPCRGGVGARLVAMEQLHLTLHFLGNVPSQQVPELRSALRLPFGASELRFSHCERWPGGLLVVSPDAVPAALADLHAALRDVLHRLGLPTEARAFRPHITLARRHAGPIPPAASPALHWKVRGYALVESGARAGGGYAVLETYGRVA
jgi:2'-5' RNA ligase